MAFKPAIIIENLGQNVGQKIMNSSLTELPQRNDYELKVPLPTYREFSEDIKKILPSDFRPQKVVIEKHITY